MKRTARKILLTSFLFPLLFLSSVLHAEDLFTCTDASGHVTISNIACPEDTSEEARASVRDAPQVIGPKGKGRRDYRKDRPPTEPQKTEAKLAEAEARIVTIRKEARDPDPAYADAQCESAKRTEQRILKMDALAESLRSSDLFELRATQDLYCLKYENRTSGRFAHK